MSAYDPSSLPRVSRVQIVDLHRIEANRVSETMRIADDAPTVALEGERAECIASLWRRLPADEQYRCHIPPYGLRFWTDEKLILQASICWECNNIFGDVDGVKFSYQFNGKAPASQQLLVEAREAFGAESK